MGEEILANAIRSHNDIKVIKIHQKEVKLSQYADDTTCFLADKNSANKLFQLLDTFKECSGLELNAAKTEGLWLGSNKQNTQKPFGIRWPEEPIHALGIDFSYNHDAAIEGNFEAKLSSLQKILNMWSARNLTLLGKINIIKTLALSKLIFNTSVLPVPINIIKKVNKCTTSFIWNYKPAKIKQSTLIGPKNKGGLQCPGFDIINKSLKIAWVKRLADSQQSNCSWKIIPSSVWRLLFI